MTYFTGNSLTALQQQEESRLKSRTSKTPRTKSGSFSPLDIKLDEPLKKLLAGLQSDMNSPAIIAGGYPRDLVLGRKPNDVDLFLLDSPNTAEVVEEYIPNSLGWKPGEFCVYHENYIGPFSTYTYGDKKFQVILVGKNKTSVVSKFDFSINQIYFDTDGSLKLTPTFKKTLETKEVVEFHRVSDARYYDFVSRFPEFNFPVRETKKTMSKKEYMQSLFDSGLVNINIDNTQLQQGQVGAWYINPNP